MGGTYNRLGKHVFVMDMDDGWGRGMDSKGSNIFDPGIIVDPRIIMVRGMRDGFAGANHHWPGHIIDPGIIMVRGMRDGSVGVKYF